MLKTFKGNYCASHKIVLDFRPTIPIIGIVAMHKRHPQGIRKTATNHHFEETDMYSTPEQFASAGKAGFENFFSVASTGFAGVEKLIELNIAISKAAFDDAAQTARAALEVKDAKEFMAFNASLAQPVVEKSISYSKQVYGIVAETQAALRKAAEAQSADVQKEFATLIDKSLKNAPAGSETAVAAVKSAVAAATSAYDNASKIAKQAFDMAEANLANVATSAAENVKAATKSASKRK